MSEAKRDRLAWAGLALIMALALGLRVWNLGNESPWYDEVITAGGVDAPSVPAFFEHWRLTNWNAVPVYYVLEYYWANVIGGSVLSLRWLSILFGMLAIPVIYQLGREAFGRSAGLVAALCLALSSVHIYQAQEIRNYSMTTFAAVLCGYTFYRFLTRDSWGNFVANAFANLFLVWTHLFGCYLLLACGITLILCRIRSRFPRTSLWFVANLALMIPSVLWIRTFADVQYYQPPAPKLWMVVNNMLTDVWSPTLNWGLPAGYSWQLAPTAWRAWLAQSAYRADSLLLYAFLGLIILVTAATLWRARRNHAPASNAMSTVIFLLLWLVVPGMILLLLSWTWRTDVFSPKYTTYSSLAAYLLTGAAAQAIPRPLWRALPAVLVAGLLLHRVAVVQAFPQRPNWYGATDVLRQDTGDTPVIMYPDWQVEALSYNLRPLDPPVTPLADLSQACAEVNTLLEKHRDTWFVWAGGFGNIDFADRYCAYLDARDVAYERQNFWGGMKCIVVVRANRPPGYRPLEEDAQEAVFTSATAGFHLLNDGTSAAFKIEK